MHHTTDQRPRKYVVRYLDPAPIDALLEYIRTNVLKTNADRVSPSELEVLCTVWLVQHMAVQLNGHTPVTGKQLQQIVDSDQIESIANHWRPAVRNTIEIFERCLILFSTSRGVKRGVQFNVHASADELSRMRIDANGVMYTKPPARMR